MDGQVMRERTTQFFHSRSSVASFIKCELFICTCMEGAGICYIVVREWGWEMERRWMNRPEAMRSMKGR